MRKDKIKFLEGMRFVCRLNMQGNLKGKYINADIEFEYLRQYLLNMGIFLYIQLMSISQLLQGGSG